MTPTERERIEKEADEYGQWVMDKTKDFHDGINAKDAYIAGATSEHDKVRNQTIQDCIDIVSVTPGDENVIPKLEKLKAGTSQSVQNKL